MTAPMLASGLSFVAVVSIAWCLHLVWSGQRSAAVRRRFPSTRRLPGAVRAGSVPQAERRAVPVPGWFDRRVSVLDLPVASPVLWRRWLIAIPSAVAVGAVVGGPALAILSGAGVMVTPWVASWLLRGRRDRRVAAQLPALFDAIGSSLRSGRSLRESVVDAMASAPTPLGSELAPVVRAVAAGASLAEELDSWAGASRLTAIQMVSAVLVVGLRDGGPQSRAIDGVASTLRDRLAVEGEVRALSSPAKASAAVIVAAPVMFAVLSVLVDPSVMQFLVASPPGVACLVMGATLEAAGGVWMSLITGAAT